MEELIQPNNNLAAEITRATDEEERIEQKLDTNVTRIDGRIDTTNNNLAELPENG